MTAPALVDLCDVRVAVQVSLISFPKQLFKNASHKQLPSNASLDERREGVVVINFCVRKAPNGSRSDAGTRDQSFVLQQRLRDHFAFRERRQFTTTEHDPTVNQYVPHVARFGGVDDC
ncbi:MAG: hypothetical protein QOE46_574 [Acidobacteriota bacterium]|nr:hypothetical protein [Acidobacteriota bacterium]